MKSVMEYDSFEEDDNSQMSKNRLSVAALPEKKKITIRDLDEKHKRDNFASQESISFEVTKRKKEIKKELI